MALRDQLLDTKLKGRLMVALQSAILSRFSKSDWTALGYATGEHEYIRNHARLLRSLDWNDDDYGHCIFQALEHFADENPDALRILIDTKAVREILERDNADLLSDLGLIAGHVPTIAP